MTLLDTINIISEPVYYFFSVIFLAFMVVIVLRFLIKFIFLPIINFFN